ncbi:MAG: DUF47 family protein [Candidatus Hydrogenedentota bacterium]|nr:MAG: DUF47 family protein [Candidatus Hydrogenedentota bacterium]
MGIFSFLFKKEETDFYRLLMDHSEKVYEAYKALTAFLKEGRGDSPLGDDVMRLEREADDIRRILIDKLNQTLVTPFDREDINELSREIDDVIDAAKSTVEEIRIFEVDPDKYLLKMSEILEKGTLELHDALRNLEEHPNVAKEHAVRAKQTENHIHHVYLSALQKLFKAEDRSAGYMFEMREIYRHLNRSSDRCDDAANVILDIIVKTE